MKLIHSFALFIALPLAAHAAPLKVVATLPDLADLVHQVGGDHVEVSSLASGLEDPHNVMMKPSMITRLMQADLFVELGLGLEHAYAPALLLESRNQKIQVGKQGYLQVSKGISVLEVPRSLDRTEGDVHPLGNPHINLDPGRMRQVVGNIADKLAELDPANAATYRSNAAAYQARLDAKLRGWKAKLAGRNIKFVSYHPDLIYFAERFGLEQAGTIQPKPGVEPGPRYIEELIARMKQEGANLIVKESFYSDRLPKQIAAKTGARLVTIPVLVHGTREATDYIAFMDTVVNAFAGR